jgi:uncharacterized membrane protein
MSHRLSRGLPPRWALLTLWALIIAFSLYFSAIAIRRHDAHLTHKADLGQIDQAIWNTAQGRFVQEVKGEQLSTRLSDHVEPIFLPLSGLFLLWDDVRILLIAQVVAVALGAWPVFFIAWQRLDLHWGREPAFSPAASPRTPSATAGYQALAALAFVLAYLLYPPLQAALLTEFHALPLATPLLLLAFLFSERQQWGRFILASLLVATVQEGMALLTAALGIYALARGLWLRRRLAATQRGPTRWPALAGAIVLLAGLLWFYLATFVVIPAHAAAAYGLSESPYVARFGALGDSFGDVVRTLLTRPGQTLRVALEPARVGYLFRMIAPVGFLALFGPEILLIGLPLLLANLLSGFPFQYSGLLHYSAPLAAFALMGAIVGSQRLRRLTRRVALSLRNRRLWQIHRAYAPLTLWLLIWSIASQIAWGHLPTSARPGELWPTVTQHQRLLARFSQQIPQDAALSTMATLYPHLSHRQQLYEFPALADSQYVLLDIAAASGWAMHPTALRDRVQELLASGQWTVQDAADGYLLLRRQENSPLTNIAQLPAEFFSFAQPSGQPQHPLDLVYTGPQGEQIQLIGYDLLSDPQWRRTAFRLYWQALTPLPAGLTLRAFAMTPDGREVDSSDERPLIQTLWLPPERWQPGQVVVTDKLAWYLPKQWALAAGVYQGGGWSDLAGRWRLQAGDPATTLFDAATWTTLGAWQWQRSRLQPMEPPQFAALDKTFGGDGWLASLSGIEEPRRAAPGSRIPITLRWQAQGPSPRDLTIFLHVRNAQGAIVAQGDAMPTWFGAQPTTQWPYDQTVFSAHSIPLPAELKPGVYDLVAGWYYWQTLERLALLDDAGQPVGDSLVVGKLEVDTTAAQHPDLACAVAPEACASQ